MSDPTTLLVEAYKAAADTMHVLITINSALIGGTVAFQKDFFTPAGRGKIAVAIAFVLFGLSIVAAVTCLLGITTCINDTSCNGIHQGLIRWPSLLALVLFVVGICAYTVAGIQALSLTGQGIKPADRKIPKK